MDPASLATFLSAGLIGLLAAAALLLGGRLLATAGPGHADGWLGVRLIGSALIVAAFGGLALGLGEPRGTTIELGALTLAAAGSSLHLLDVPFTLAATSNGEGQASLPPWGLAVPLVLPAGLLAWAWGRWPASPLPAGDTFAEWSGWAGYDAVEDTSVSLAMGCLALAVLGATLILLVRAYTASGEARAASRRMLAQGWLPVLGWIGALALVFASAGLQPTPADPVTLLGQEVLLRSFLPFGFTVVGPLLWGLDRVCWNRQPRGPSSPVSNRS